MNESSDQDVLTQMRLAGLTFERWKDGKSLLASTEDPELAKEYGMHDPSELL